MLLENNGPRTFFGSCYFRLDISFSYEMPSRMTKAPPTPDVEKESGDFSSKKSHKSGTFSEFFEPLVEAFHQLLVLKVMAFTFQKAFVSRGNVKSPVFLVGRSAVFRTSALWNLSDSVFVDC